MELRRNFKFLLLLVTIGALGFLAISYYPRWPPLLPTLTTCLSTRRSVVHPLGDSLRPLVNIRVNGSDRAHLVEQYRSQLNEYFKKEKNEDDAVYRSRQSLVEHFCKENLTDQRIRPKNNAFLYTDDPPVLYCPAAKAGSTFLHRLLAAINTKDPKTFSPFQIVHESAPVLHLTLGDHDKEEQYKTYPTSKYKFMFTRDPYHRLFSAFIDKFLSPNYYMWDFGKNAVAMFRSTTSKDDAILGSSVRFHEFIKYINTQDKQHINTHVKPVSYICNLCSLKYDIIGKLETFKSDVNYILDRIGALNKKIIIRDMKFERDLDQIFEYIPRCFEMQKGWLTYISRHAGMQRLWRQLQINGLIDMTDTYPFSPEQSHNVTVVEYINVALEAFRRSSPAAKYTKREAYLQAYSMLEPEDLEKLRKGFLSDFDMFDYEQRPAELFDMNRNRTFHYDYFDVMQLK